MRDIIIGNAWHDENGKAVGGKAGDQLQTGTHDYNGEVRLQPFYKSSKGWTILRFKNRKYAKKVAKLMIKACDNKNIGYSQSSRYGIIDRGIKSTVPTNCDCSSLVRECIIEATGYDVPDFSTATEVLVLRRTGLFEEPYDYEDGFTLYTGDIIVTRIKGHTAIITDGEPLDNTYPKPEVAVTSKLMASANDIDLYVYEGEVVKWVQYQLCKAGYQKIIDFYGGIDGICGQGTVECIREFQLDKRLEASGVCGVKTRKKLAKI